MLRRRPPGLENGWHSHCPCSRFPLFTQWSTPWPRRSFPRRRGFCVRPRRRQSESHTSSSEESNPDCLVGSGSTITNRRVSVTTLRRNQCGWHIKPRDRSQPSTRARTRKTIAIRSKILNRTSRLKGAAATAHFTFRATIARAPFRSRSMARICSRLRCHRAISCVTANADAADGLRFTCDRARHAPPGRVVRV